MVAASSRLWMGAIAFAGAAVLSGCGTTRAVESVATAAPDMKAETDCLRDKPLGDRLIDINAQLKVAFATAPPLSEAEYDHMRRLGSCTGAMVLGSGAGCDAEWAQAKASGLAERSRLSGAQYSIPRWVGFAQAAPVRSTRIRDLVLALMMAKDAHENNAVRLATGQVDEATVRPTLDGLRSVTETLMQTIVCESPR